MDERGHRAFLGSQALHVRGKQKLQPDDGEAEQTVINNSPFSRTAFFSFRMLSCQPHGSSQQESRKERGICELYY